MSTALPPTNDPTFHLYANHRSKIIGAVVTIFILTTAAVSLRFLSRKLSRAGLWWDDYLCAVALVISLTCPTILLIELRKGYGRHIYIHDSAHQLEYTSAMLKDIWVFELLYHTATTVSKFAILAFYHRVFPVPRFRRSLYWIAGLCTLYMIAVDLAILFQCRPIHYTWDQVRPGAKGYCFKQIDFFIGSGAINATLNFLIFGLPIPLLRRLRATVRQQIVLAALFTLAGFVVLVSIIWVIVLSKLILEDITWNYINSGIWSALEPNMAVVCACIPSLRPLFDIISRDFSRGPPAHSTLTSADKASMSKRIFGVSSRQSNRDFSQLDETDDTRPLGHGVSIHGGKAETGQTDEEAIELPDQGIAVKTEVILATTDRLDYNVRLF